jgi:hypothetical protein
MEFFEKLKRWLSGDKLAKEFNLILVIAFCSFWIGAMLILLDQLKNLLVIAGGISPKDIVFYAPLLSLPINVMVLWDFALVLILICYFTSLTSVYYYTKRRIASQMEKDK